MLHHLGEACHCIIFWRPLCLIFQNTKNSMIFLGFSLQKKHFLFWIYRFLLWHTTAYIFGHLCLIFKIEKPLFRDYLSTRTTVCVNLFFSASRRLDETGCCINFVKTPLPDFWNRKIYNSHGVVSPRGFFFVVYLSFFYNTLFGRNRVGRMNFGYWISMWVRKLVKLTALCIATEGHLTLLAESSKEGVLLQKVGVELLEDLP